MALKRGAQRDRPARRKIDPSGDNQEFSGNPQQRGMRNPIHCGAMHEIALSLVSCRTGLMPCPNLGVIEEGVEHDRNSGFMRSSDHYRSVCYVAIESAFAAETLGAALERHISSGATLCRAFLAWRRQYRRCGVR
ncbi:hypothetical protein ASD01_17010 [Ensifer sp. Root423]|uniref:hypothetical protein n=1 Tax=Ensifer sp. Root423 TaxID=1736534 RepID=UPI0007136B4E|nr:hypothetical protein [Ensifer sp. Root423]KQX02987.1 hypothetical protein ASD01_17010 [Ensifer sp. Root423]